jgi:DNA helicase HerA-like ATPase
MSGRSALEHEGGRFVAEEVRKTGYATIDYLLDRAEQGRFHSNDMVNLAIAHRLRMVKRSGLFSDDPRAETLRDVFARVAATGGFVVFDLGEMSPGRLRALTSGLNRRLDDICVEERESGRGRYPFVFYEESHFYAAPNEIINLITRGRHLGLTTFFLTNSPGELPEVIFRQLDNLIVTGLSHSADLRTIAKSAVSDEDTLRSLAIGLPRDHAMIVGRLTSNFPLMMQIDPLPEGFPATGITRSFLGPAHRRVAIGPANGSGGPTIPRSLCSARARMTDVVARRDAVRRLGRSIRPIERIDARLMPVRPLPASPENEESPA